MNEKMLFFGNLRLLHAKMTSPNHYDRTLQQQFCEILAQQNGAGGLAHYCYHELMVSLDLHLRVSPCPFLKDGAEVRLPPGVKESLYVETCPGYTFTSLQ